MRSHALNCDVDSVQRETAHDERAHDDSAANDVDDGASLCRGEFPSIVAGFCETCIGGRMEVLLGQKMEIFPMLSQCLRTDGGDDEDLGDYLTLLRLPGSSARMLW